MWIRRFLTTKSLLFTALVAIVVILVIVARAVKPKPEEGPRFGHLPEPPIQSIEQFKKPASQIGLFPDLSLPEKMKVYAQNPYTLSEEQARQIATSLGFEQGAMQGKLFLSQEEGKYLAINPATGLIFINQPIPEYLTSFSEESLKDFALTLAKPTLLEERIWETPVMTVSFLQEAGAHEAIPASPAQADSAEVQIYPSLEGRRIVGKDLRPIGDVASVTVKYFKHQESVSLRTTVIAVNFAEIGTYPLKSPEEVRKAIADGQPVVSAIIPEGRSLKDIRYGEVLLPTDVQYSQIEIVYYFDPNPSALLQPIFLLTGTTSLEDGTPAEVKATLPAIDPEYLQSP